MINLDLSFQQSSISFPQKKKQSSISYGISFHEM